MLLAFVVGLIGVGAVGVGIAATVARLQGGGEAKSARLLGDLFEIHQLSAAERRLVQQLALDLEQPAMLLVVPEHFDEALAQADLRPGDHAEAVALRDRIFAA